MPSPTPTPRERHLEILVVDLRQAATDLWRELQETKAAAPTACACRALSGEALYELGVAVLRARWAERAAAVAHEEAEACRREADDLRGRLADEADLVAYWCGVHAAVAAAAVPLSPGEPATDVLAHVGRAMGSDPADSALDGERTLPAASAPGRPLPSPRDLSRRPRRHHNDRERTMTTITTKKPKDWDEERISRHARMLAMGMSMRDIGAANAVLGLCFRRREAGDDRFGLRPKRVGRTPEEAAEARRLRDAAKRERGDAVAARRASRAGRRTPPRPRIDLGPDPSLGLSLWDVGARQCHWIGAGGYCAQPCGRATFCAHHVAIVYRPSAPVTAAAFRGVA